MIFPAGDELRELAIPQLDGEPFRNQLGLQRIDLPAQQSASGEIHPRDVDLNGPLQRTRIGFHPLDEDIGNRPIQFREQLAEVEANRSGLNAGS